MSGQARETVLVTGASSQLGVFLLPRLQAAGYGVLALSRKAPAASLEVAPNVTWSRPDTLDRVSPGPLRHIVSCGPLELACDFLESRAPIERAVVFSTSSVLAKLDTPDRDESRRLAAIARTEIRLRAVCARAGTALLLLRPTLIWGCGLDRNISLLARFGRRFGFIPVAGDAGGLRQPVHADDLASLAVQALGAQPPIELESPACGGSTLTYRAMVERIAGCGEKRVSVVSLPGSLLGGLVALSSRLPGLDSLNAEMVRRQGQDMTFDDSTLRDALGSTPRPFEPRPADFVVPPIAAALQLP